MDRNFNEPVALQITFLQVAKGGLISESFSLWLNLQIKDPNHSWALCTKEEVLKIVISNLCLEIWELSEIKPPFKKDIVE